MSPLVKTPTQKLEKYRGLISEELFEEIKETGQNLRGLGVSHVNSTPRGGGVAEVLKDHLELYRKII